MFIVEHHYESHIVGESYTKPYVIFVYSDWCYACKRLEPLWQRLVDEIGPMGVGLATVNNVFQVHLVHWKYMELTP